MDFIIFMLCTLCVLMAIATSFYLNLRYIVHRNGKKFKN